MIDDDDIEELLARLRCFPRRLRELVADASDADLKRAAPGGGWGAVEVFCHLRDLDDLFIERVTRIVTEDEPYMPAIDETLWPIERDYVSQNPRVALEQFAENRARFTALLAGLTDSQWRRRGHHAELGEQSAQWYAAHAAEHDAMHEEYLRDLLA